MVNVWKSDTGSLCIKYKQLLKKFSNGTSSPNLGLLSTFLNNSAEISAENYGTGCQNKISEKYYLSSIICHIGPSGMGGHFITIGRSAQNSPWYIYNDSSVTKISDNELTQILSGEDKNRVPYIATYHKIQD